MNRGTCYLLLSIVLFQCKEPVDIESVSSNLESLVVDGFITTEAKAHVVTLRKTRPFVNNDIGVFQIIADANGSVRDQFGNVEPLDNQFNGDYQTSNDYQAAIGSTYTLRIEFEGQVFESTPQEVFPPHEILDIYAEKKIMQFLVNDLVIDQEVMNFFMDYRASDQVSYGIHDWAAEFSVDAVYYEREGEVGFSGTTNHNVSNTLVNERVQLRQILHNRRFNLEYNMDVTLYSVSKSAYDFHSRVLQQRELDGSVFALAPLQIEGNIFSINDPNQIAFGHFGAFSVSNDFVSFWEASIPESID